ncbi:MAG TPA: FAD-dependent oxidoreductase [bacterium]|nr:FAD-dependent oxidoreductase [bacterium]
MRYVVVGAGPAGVVGAETLRKIDPTGTVTLIGGEPEVPYSRMAIPYLLEGNIDEAGTHLRHDPEHYRKAGIEVLQGKRVTKVDTQGQQVTLDDGQQVPYDKLLLATGSRPLQPPIPGVDQEGIYPCWTLAHAREIKSRLGEGKHVVLIGAGFIGSIILDAIGSQSMTLTVVEAETHMTPRMMNEAGGGVMKAWCASKGVQVLTSTRVNSIEAGGERRFTLQLDSGQALPADVVVTATGVKPILDYLEGSGIKTDEGILVNEFLQTSDPNVYAAGDTAQGLNFSTGGFSVHAIQPTATEHGQIAALNMAGKSAKYKGSLIMNVIALLGLTTYSFGQWMGVEGGEHGEWLDEANHRYIRLEFKDDVLVGAIHIGQFEQVGILRGMIQNRIPLGQWKDMLKAEPTRIMDAYLGLTDYGKKIPIMPLAAG